MIPEEAAIRIALAPNPILRTLPSGGRKLARRRTDPAVNEIHHRAFARDIPWARQMAARKILARRELYEATGNPTFLWEAYHLCRKAGTGVPEWIMCHFDQIAANVLALVRTHAPPEERKAGESSGGKNGRVGSEIASAFMFKKPGRSGRRNYLREYWSGFRSHMDQLDMAMRVATELKKMEEEGDPRPKLTAAYSAASRSKEQFHSDARRAWKAFGTRIVWRDSGRSNRNRNGAE